jgi:hypothetical protein
MTITLAIELTIEVSIGFTIADKIDFVIAKVTVGFRAIAIGIVVTAICRMILQLMVIQSLTILN